VLADPAVPREPLDDLKYFPLSTSDARTYLSLGANVRERLEVNDAQFGIGGNQQKRQRSSGLGCAEPPVRSAN
jgi:hypothetical protein